MADVLDFSESQPRYDENREIILFRGRIGSAELRCAISREAIEDHFRVQGYGPAARLRAFTSNRKAIEECAQSKYVARQFEPDGSILIRTMDII